jgi:fumarate reductase flavoprotein subunit
LSELALIKDELGACGVADANRAFNLSWHDWLNLNSLVDTSRVIAEAALARSDSRGAHYREDFPESGPLENSSYTSLQMEKAGLKINTKPVAFTRVRPGETLLVRNL